MYLGRCEDGLEVALKFTPAIEDLSVESGVYDALESIQGSVLPKLYGVLYGREVHGESCSCLVIERFGSCLDRNFCSLKPLEKSALISCCNSGY